MVGSHGVMTSYILIINKQKIPYSRTSITPLIYSVNTIKNGCGFCRNGQSLSILSAERVLAIISKIASLTQKDKYTAIAIYTSVTVVPYPPQLALHPL